MALTKMNLSLPLKMLRVLAIAALFAPVASFSPTSGITAMRSYRNLCREPAQVRIKDLAISLPRNPCVLTTRSDAASNAEDEKPPGFFQRAKQKFKARPGTYLLIPCIAAVVGWFTNYLAVQMIFYPVQFRGIPLYRRPEIPLGFLGWQGIVPCKTKQMSITMVDMVTSQLLSVKEAFDRLDPKKMAKLLAPRVPMLAEEVAADFHVQKLFLGPSKAVYDGMSEAQRSIINHFNTNFLTNMIKEMQGNIDTMFNLQNCVVEQMLKDRSKLGELFRKCGQKELDFLTNSGLWFGFLLGLIQMAVALVWENPWTLSIGGGIVGLATNWLALKWIFEPVNPTKIGPFILQGQFLRRQKEVAAEFSDFFANNILTSSKLWNSILTDPETSPSFNALFSSHFQKFTTRISKGLFRGTPEQETLDAVTRSAISKLPNHVPVLHEYIDKTLGLQKTLRIKMEAMTSLQFERVLHPIFEEDELTLILAGAALGFAAGLVQQGLETGTIKITNPMPRLRRTWSKAKSFTKKSFSQSRRIRKRWIRRITRSKDKPEGGEETG